MMLLRYWQLIGLGILIIVAATWHWNAVADARKDGVQQERASWVVEMNKLRAEMDAEKQRDAAAIERLAHELGVKNQRIQEIRDALETAIATAERSGAGKRPGLDRSLVRELDKIRRG